MFGFNHWWRRPQNQTENAFSVVTESFLTGGTESVGVGSSFTYEGSDATLSVRDNDRKMAGDAWRNERGTDTQPGTLTTNSGDTVDAGNIYAERYLILRDSNGTCYTMIEIEGTNLSNDPTQDDVFAFYGAVPAVGAELTVVSAGNVWFGVKYNALNGGPAAIVLEATDDALTVDMGAVSSANLLTNDIGNNAVIASFAGTSIDATGGPTLIEVDGIVFMVSPDGQITIDPQNSAEGIALPDGETLEITVSYAITDGTNTSEAVLTLTLEGVNDAPELTGQPTVLDNFTLQEQQDGEDYSVDLNSYFSDPDGDALTLTSDNLPAGFEIVDGVLGLDGSEIAHGDHTITVTADDGNGGSVSTDLTFIAALNLVSSDTFTGETLALEGTEIADSVRLQALQSFEGGTLELDLKGGDDLVFVREGGFSSGTANINTGAGNDSVEFGRSLFNDSGALTLDTGTGDDQITFGQSAVRRDGTIFVDAGQGADAISFGDFGGGQTLPGAGTVTIDLGEDADRDVLSFANVADVTVQNWTQGVDAAIVIDINPSAYVAREENGNTIFEAANGRTMVVEGVTGVSYREILEGYNSAPTFVGTDTALDNFTAAEQQGGGDYSVDLNGLFSDADGDALTLTSGPLPAGFEIVNGVLGLDGAPVDAGDHTITVTVEDDNGGSLNQDLTFSVALNIANTQNNALSGQTTVLEGTEIDDSIVYSGFNIARGNGSNLTIDTSGGDDLVDFSRAGSFLSEDTFGQIATGSGADTVLLGAGHARFQAQLNIDLGSDDDTFAVANSFGGVSGNVTIDSGAGADTLDFGEDTGAQSGNVQVNAGADDDVITFGVETAFNRGTVEVDAGTGADTVRFGRDAGEANGSILVDLGLDSDADTLIFGARVDNASVVNWVDGVDAKIQMAGSAGSWTARVDGSDTVFENGAFDVTLVGVTGVTVSDVFDFA